MPNFDSVSHLDLSGRLVVVAGGTQGIGAGIAALCARLGALVAIIGRNTTLGEEVLEKLSAESKEKSLEHDFIAGDLSTVAGVKEVARIIKEWAGEKKVDYLFMSQGGPPSATPKVTADDLDYHFAMQAVSRFVLAYTLVEQGVLKSDGTIVSIAAPGHGSKTLDFDNFDAKGYSVIGKMTNSAAVVDCFTKEFGIRHPPLRVLHLYPGSVSTNVMANSQVPWYLYYPFQLMRLLPYVSRTAEQYAPVPLWIATNAEDGVCCWDQNGAEIEISAPAKDEAVRAKVWDKLVGLASGAK